LSSTSKAVIIAFNVRPDQNAKNKAEDEKTIVLYHSIIYALIDDIKNSIEGRLEPTKIEKFLGKAEIREVFNIPKIGVVAGSAVIDGKIVRSSFVRLVRDNVVIYNGKLGSLRRFKEDVKEVASGYECGISIEKYKDVKVGDIVEAYIMEDQTTKIY